MARPRATARRPPKRRHSLPVTAFTLSSLATNTTFHYQVVGTDRAGNVTTSSDQTFSTSSGENTVITGVAVSVLSGSSVTVTWTTNHASDSKVRYGFTTDYGSEVYDATW